MANAFYLSVTATKQGVLKGESGKDRSRIPILGFSYSVHSPRDPASGQATGKRQHEPVTVFKEWGVISPQLFEALVTNEVLTSVIIDEVRVSPKGKKENYMEIRLTNASLVEIIIEPEQFEDQPLWADKEIEQISFVFEKIEFENKVSKAVAEDDWEQRV